MIVYELKELKWLDWKEKYLYEKKDIVEVFLLKFECSYLMCFWYRFEVLRMCVKLLIFKYI